MSRFTACCALVSLCMLVRCTALLAQSTIRVGGEFQVPNYTMGEQRIPDVALDADGDFVVVWHGQRDGSTYGVFALRFSSAGVAQAQEFQVNTRTVYTQRSATVSLDATGDFVVAWQTYHLASGYDVVAQRFNSAGVRQAAEFHVNAYTTDDQRTPLVAMDGDGDFVVAWASYAQDGSMDGLFARRFSAAGARLATEFQVSTFTVDIQSGLDLAAGSGGDFVATWHSVAQDGSGTGVFARRFNAAGTPQAVEFQVSTRTLDSQSAPAVARRSDGEFVVVWTWDAADDAVMARRFDAAGVGLATELEVDAEGVIGSVDAAADSSGDFVIVWHGDAGGDSNGIVARRFGAGGTFSSPELLVNTHTAGIQNSPAAGMDATGDFVVAWTSFDQDGSGAGVFAQRFTALAILDIDGSGETSPLTDGLLVLRFLFGFTGAPLVAGATDAVGCTRCSAAAIEAYLELLI